MIIQCESCSRKFIVKDSDIPEGGRTVQCGHCSVTWHQKSPSVPNQTIRQTSLKKSFVETDDSPSVDSIKASDGKTYKFLGSQWAELLPSGKTGLFARKKFLKSLTKLQEEKKRKFQEKERKNLRKLIHHLKLWIMKKNCLIFISLNKDSVFLVTSF